MPAFPKTEVSARCILAAVFLLLPWLNGGADPFTRPLFYGLLAISWLLVLLGLRKAPQRRKLPILILPLGLGLLLGIVHLLPLFPGQAGGWSTSAVRLRQSMSGEDIAAWVPHTLNPTETRSQLAAMIAATTVFLAAFELFGKTRACHRFLALMAVNGGFVALYGIGQHFTWSGKLFNLLRVPENHTTFGPFVYHNLAGAFLVMCLPMVYCLYGPPQRRRLKDPPGKGWHAQVVVGFLAWVADLDGRRLTAMAAATFISAAIVASLSRGALLSALIAGAILLPMHLWRRGSRQIPFAVASVILLGLLSLCFVGLDRIVASRVQTLGDVEQLIVRENRLQVWKDSLPLTGDFTWFGTGWGGFSLTYPLYQSQELAHWWTHAHNQYLEAMVDGGLVGVTLLLATVVGALAGTLCLMRSERQEVRALGTISLFVIASQAFHATVDYCLYLPAVYGIVALIGGMVFAQLMTRRNVPAWGSLTVPSSLVRILYLGMLVALLWGVGDAVGDARLQLALASINWQEQPQQPGWDDHIHALEAALAIKDSHLGQEALAELCVRRYELEAAERLRNELGAPDISAEIRSWSTLAALHQRVSRLTATNSQLAALLKADPTIRHNLGSSLRHLQQTIRISPLLPHAHIRACELAFLRAEPPETMTDHLAIARRLGRADSDVLYEAGLVYFRAGHDDQACSAWKACLAVSDLHLTNIAAVAGPKIGLPQLFDRVLPQRTPAVLLEIALRLPAGKEAVRESLIEEAQRGFTESDISDAERHHYVSLLQQAQGLRTSAIDQLRAAVRLAPENVDWRTALARLLLEDGQLQQARLQALICYRLAPTNKHYQLVRQIERQSRHRT